MQDCEVGEERKRSFILSHFAVFGRAAVYALLRGRLCAVYGARCMVGSEISRPQAVRRQVEDTMAMTIFMSLCVAAVGFLLYCLFNFGQELRHEPRIGSDDDLRIESQKLNVVPVQFVGPASMVTWSEDTWRRVLASKDDSKSRNLTGKDAENRHYDAAA